MRRKRAGVLLCLAVLVACATPKASDTRPAPVAVSMLVQVPRVVEHAGGAYFIPWTAWYDVLRRDVLKCVGLDTSGARPSIWVVRQQLHDGPIPLAGMYDTLAHALVISGTIPDTAFLPVVMHELVHSKERIPGHGERFALAQQCGFWP